jgi:hypothetical protein
LQGFLVKLMFPVTPGLVTTLERLGLRPDWMVVAVGRCIVNGAWLRDAYSGRYATTAAEGDL